jgi:cation diffusion facilitator CzcD-associated flavoprotein CzcO
VARGRVHRVNHDVVVIGAGFSGLRMAIKLNQAGITDFVVLGKGTEVVADYELKPYIRPNTEAVKCTFDSSAARWSVTTASGHVLTARVVVAEQRPVHQPCIPDLPGLSTFAGPAFHPARWDHSFDVAGRRVGVISRGAGAVPFVPRVARTAAQVLVFQRPLLRGIRPALRVYHYGTRPNIELITDEVENITADTIVTRHGAHRVDAIIFATGFHLVDGTPAVEVIGRSGVSLRDSWRAGATAYLGMTVAGFPNLFLLLGPDSGGGDQSVITMIEAQVRYIMACLRMMGRTDSRAIEVQPHVQAGFSRWPESGVSYRHRTRRPNPRHFSLTPFEGDLDETHRGPAVVSSNGPEIAVEVHLTGHIQPIDGSFRWYGRITEHPEVTALHEAGHHDITIRLPGSTARKARLTELDPWGNARVTGTGQPPFPIP